MGTALSVVDIITEAEHVFLEFVDILERTFHGNALRFPFEINRIVDCLFVLIQIAHKTNNAIRLVIRQVLLFSIAQIGKINGKRRVQICSLMETAFDLCCGKTCFLKDFRIRQEVDAGSAVLRFSDLRQQPILIEFLYGNTSFVAVVINPAAEADLYVKIGGKRIDNRRTDTVQTAACLVRIVVEFTAGVQGCKNETLRRNAFFMHADRDSAAVVGHGRRAVCFKCYVNGVAVARKMLVHRIVYNFINQMIQAFPRGTSDIHTRALTHCFETFQHGNTAGIIRFFFWHNCSILTYVLLSFSLKNTSVCPILGHSILLYHFSSRNSKIFFRRKNLLRSSAP